MTIGAWIGFAVIVATLGCIYWFIFTDSYYKSTKIVWGIICGGIAVVALIGMLWYYGNSEWGRRALKSQRSNLEGGITREVKVYDVTGNLIQKYSGKFDIEYDDDRILFDDEDGKRHTIYYPTGTVIVDEVD